MTIDATTTYIRWMIRRAEAEVLATARALYGASRPGVYLLSNHHDAIRRLLEADARSTEEPQ